MRQEKSPETLQNILAYVHSEVTVYYPGFS